MRAELSKRFIFGQGVEIGALHFPLPLFNGATATYVDRMPLEELKKKFPEVAVEDLPIIVDDEWLNTAAPRRYPTGGLGFIVANHVVEHLEYPIMVLKHWLTLLKPGGVLFMALPIRDQCFDRDRKNTTWEHLTNEEYDLLHCYESDPARDRVSFNRLGHYMDWIENVDKIKDVHAAFSKLWMMFAQRENIHFHCWDKEAILDLAKNFQSVSKRSIKNHLFENGSEMIWIIEKAQA